MSTADLITISLTTSFAGNMVALAVWLHFDLEEWWEQRRLEHGRRLDARQRRAAEEHGR